MNRSEAMSLGLKRYSSKPCPKGHVCERYCSNFQCCTCVYLGNRKWEAAHPEQRRQTAVNKSRRLRLRSRFHTVLSSSDISVSAIRLKEDATDEA